jgi:penicillin-binding protein 1C
MPKCCLLATLLIAAAAQIHCAAATFDAVKRAYTPSDTVLLSREGEVLQRLRTDSAVRRGQWTALADVSPALRTALVLSEDKRFYEHSGVDWRAVSSAAWANLWNSKTRGASTISMQLVGLLDEDLKAGSGGRTVGQKIGQTVSTQVLEARWKKSEILEAYLNLVPFRGELVGIDALSRTLFDKAPNGLDEREAAVAAALVRAPNAKVAMVAQRACGVLKLLQHSKKTDCEGLDVYVAAALSRKAFEASSGDAPHVARRLLTQMRKQPSPQPSPAYGRGGKAEAPVLLPLPYAGEGRGEGASASSIASTLSAPLQRFAVQTLRQHLRELRGRHVDDGAVVVLDNATGEVLAYVGSSNELSRAADVDGAAALRQPGSTLKPFLYAQAIFEKRLTAASLIDDSSAQIPTPGGLYIPQNYDRQFKGWVSSRTALGASLNVPAVRALVMVSPDAFARQLRAVGLPLKESGDYYGFSLALGSAEVSLLNLTNAYRTLANGGRFGAVQFAQPARVAALALVLAPVLDPRAAFITTDILADPLARARTFGTDSVLSTRFWTAVKTGTSKDMRDNWAIGYSERYTVGVWVGNASGAPMWDVSGTTGAAPVWAALMNHLHRSQPSRAPTPPTGLVQARVGFDSLEAERSEWFIAGTEQAVFAPNSIAAAAGNTWAAGLNDLKGLKNSLSHDAEPRITTPANGVIIALDPDIPPSRQRVSFAAIGVGVSWRMDGKVFAKGNAAQWLPWPGRHVVQLVDAQGAVKDEVKLEVRGAGVKTGSRSAK